MFDAMIVAQKDIHIAEGSRGAGAVLRVRVHRGPDMRLGGARSEVHDFDLPCPGVEQGGAGTCSQFPCIASRSRSRCRGRGGHIEELGCDRRPLAKETSVPASVHVPQPNEANPMLRLGNAEGGKAPETCSNAVFRRSLSGSAKKQSYTHAAEEPLTCLTPARLGTTWASIGKFGPTLAGHGPTRGPACRDRPGLARN